MFSCSTSAFKARKLWTFKEPIRKVSDSSGLHGSAICMDFSLTNIEQQVIKKPKLSLNFCFIKNGDLQGFFDTGNSENQQTTSEAAEAGLEWPKTSARMSKGCICKVTSS